MSFTATMLPILSVIAIAQEQLELKRWIPINQQQTAFLNNYYSKKQELESLTEQELTSCISPDISKVNSFLREHGFTIQLNDTGNGGLAIASILDIALTWKIPGIKTVVANDTSKEFPAVSMKVGYSLYGTGKAEETVVAVHCQNNDTVYMSLADKPREGFELLAHIEALSRISRRNVTNEFSDILFPMVSIDQQVDISWLCGLTNQENWFIDQALQQTRFQMDEKGAGGTECCRYFS
jgi:hypothetical protein